FENRVAAFSQAFGKVPDRQFPIEIFLFNNEQDFIEALPHAQGEEQLKKAAYLLRGPDRTFLVAKDKSPDDIANDAGHALGHVLFERYVLWRPFWLAESAAEYVRKAGRSADTKAVSEQEGFSVATCCWQQNVRPMLRAGTTAIPKTLAPLALSSRGTRGRPQKPRESSIAPLASFRKMAWCNITLALCCFRTRKISRRRSRP